MDSFSRLEREPRPSVDIPFASAAHQGEGTVSALARGWSGCLWAYASPRPLVLGKTVSTAPLLEWRAAHTRLEPSCACQHTPSRQPFAAPWDVASLPVEIQREYARAMFLRNVLKKQCVAMGCC